ncbi:MAG: dihydroneopterin aldolase [Campylobacter sp.]|nr:dihydroneopterin aldolase [Campylobacter sp.]MBR4140338.1 dihydroneopterin aldolase [Campylobacter sp.]MBR7047266.1 dihydroneopterin aldolase [Campylobacter sp.]
MRILIENLEFECIIGILDFERNSPQPVRICTKFEADEFIDYAKICAELEKIFKEQKFELIEDALNFCKVKFKEKFPTLKYFYMKILKPKILPNAVVGVELETIY